MKQYTYTFTSKSYKRLKKLPKSIQKRIIYKLKMHCESDNPLLQAKRMIDFATGEYRFRIGDYRLIFDIEGKQIVVHDVGHRKEIYK